ncbi:MAG TPA: hypothetical protein VFV02_09780 [Acidimicrobiales bacterium]|nr:hypothetical protein [Acidimicrobiales bacterium]
MSDNSVEAFVEAILDGRPPRRSSVSPDEIDVLQVALALRASQTEFARPDPSFVEDLHRKLAATVNGVELLPIPSDGPPPSESDERSLRAGYHRGSSRQRARRVGAIGKMAAAFALVGATFTATNLVGSHSPVPVAQQAGSNAAVRSGLLLSVGGQPLGRTYTYRGNPSWIFMDVQGPFPSGVYTCELHLANGTSVPAGLVTVYNGAGDWAHTVSVEVSQLRQATLVDSSGVTVATATFS